MYPFELKFKRTINKSYSVKQVKYLLDEAQDLLKLYKVDEFKKGKNWLSFRNRILRVRFPFDVMDSTDGGLVEVSESKDHTVDVTYTVSLMRFWMQAILMMVILLFITRDPMIFGISGIVICLFGWLYVLLRHWLFCKYLVKQMAT
jgi:hypothetical protein